jgi:hypothetical protein
MFFAKTAVSLTVLTNLRQASETKRIQEPDNKSAVLIRIALYAQGTAQGKRPEGI